MDVGKKCLSALDSLPGIGTQSVKRFNKLGVFTVQDLLFHLPHRYEDRTRLIPMAELEPGQSVLVAGAIELTDVTARGRRSLLCRIRDHSGWVTLRFFHFSASQQKQLQTGRLLGCFGEVREGFHGLEMVHPEYRLLQTKEDILQDSLTPVYPLSEGLRQATVRKAVHHATAQCLGQVEELLPLAVRDRYPDVQQALHDLHHPSAQQTGTESRVELARQRLVFEELLAHHLQLSMGRRQYQQVTAPAFNIDQHHKQMLLTAFGFPLTAAQQRVCDDIEQDVQTSRPMLRLVQGDVGSGKTAVAACVAGQALANGFQVAMMAPTELLAEQHFNNFSAWFSELPFQVGLLTGKLKGKARRQVLEQIHEGSIQLIVGTHALFQDAVEFKNIGLLVIDEQHRFGVDQRLALRDKSLARGQQPHQLVMTATPIPRTQAMLQYADMDISIIDELPPGRKPVVTRVVSSKKREEVIERVSHWVAQGKQTYWVCTLIEESEQLQCEAAENTVELLMQQLPDVRIALLHGRMKADEKDRVMQAFKAHQYDLLVATTVIEVGVDVPNAGLMIIENPERLGLSQLHQLRGRVGRGELESFCLLLYQSPLSDAGRYRLGVLRDTNCGFEIAERDLELRGAGELMGTRQTGQMQFKIADLQRDKALIETIQEAGALMMRDCPEKIPALLERWLGKSREYMGV